MPLLLFLTLVICIFVSWSVLSVMLILKKGLLISFIPVFFINFHLDLVVVANRLFVNEQDWTCNHGVGELKWGWDPHIGANIWDGGQALEPSESATAHLWQSEWSENHTDKPCHSPVYLREGHKSPGTLRGGSWSTGVGEQAQSKVSCWPRGDSLRAWSGETAVKNAFGGTLSSRGGQAAPRSHRQGMEPSLQPLSARTPAPAAQQQRKTLETVALWAPDVLSNGEVL